MGPGLKKVGARRNMKGRIDVVSNACLNCADYSANLGLDLGLRPTVRLE